MPQSCLPSSVLGDGCESQPITTNSRAGLVAVTVGRRLRIAADYDILVVHAGKQANVGRRLRIAADYDENAAIFVGNVSWATAANRS